MRRSFNTRYVVTDLAKYGAPTRTTMFVLLNISFR